MSLLHQLGTLQGKGGACKDLEGDKPAPAPDQDLKSNWIFQERI